MHIPIGHSIVAVGCTVRQVGESLRGRDGFTLVAAQTLLLRGGKAMACDGGEWVAVVIGVGDGGGGLWVTVRGRNRNGKDSP